MVEQIADRERFVFLALFLFVEVDIALLERDRDIGPAQMLPHPGQQFVHVIGMLAEIGDPDLEVVDHVGFIEVEDARDRSRCQSPTARSAGTPQVGVAAALALTGERV